MKNSFWEWTAVFKCLSDETRLRIINMLTNGELCACKILEDFNISQPTLSYHMKVLMESGLVNGRRDGAWMRYTLNKEKTEELVSFLSDITGKNGIHSIYSSEEEYADNKCGAINTNAASCNQKIIL